MPLTTVLVMVIMAKELLAAKFSMPTDLASLTDSYRSALSYKLLIQAMVERSLFALTIEAPMSMEEISTSVTEPSRSSLRHPGA